MQNKRKINYFGGIQKGERKKKSNNISPRKDCKRLRGSRGWEEGRKDSSGLGILNVAMTNPAKGLLQSFSHAGSVNASTEKMTGEPPSPHLG